MSENGSSNTPHPQRGREIVNQHISTPKRAVVLFSLSWCSFCHAAKQLLTQLDLSFKVIELDQGEFLEPTMQREVRTRLRELTQANTLPQLFIAGEVIGGYTDLAAAYKNGTLTALLEQHRIASKLTPSV